MTQATGGSVTFSGGQKRHTFTASGDLVVTETGDVSYLLVGGGGGAGRQNAITSAGGGGGAVKTGTSTLAVATYPVVIGAGGAGVQTDGVTAAGSDGNPSTFNSITAGGGGNGGRATVAGGAGANGSAGGGGGNGNTNGTNPAGGTGSSPGGNGGAGFGSATNSLRASGGGGGSSANGVAAASSTAGAGGAGTASSLSGASVTYGAGGGGGASAGTAGAAGGTGAGAGQNNTQTGYPNGLANRGGGGGGVNGNNGAGGGNGGSGVAIFAYPYSVTVTDAGDELYETGDAVTVTGTNFLAPQGGGVVKISPTDNINDVNAVTQTVNTWADTSIAITVVRGSLAVATSMYLFVRNSDNQANAAGFAVQFNPAPVTVTDAGDEAFDNGEAVTLTGTNFLGTQGDGTVVLSPTDNINDAGAVTQTVNTWANTSVGITTVKGALAYATTVYLFVRNSYEVANASGYAVQFNAPPAVTITDAGDETYNHGEAVTITGTNFQASQGDGVVLISPTDNVNDAGVVEQTVNTWSGTSIGITAVKGALPIVSTVYLFVRNSLEVANLSGYAVSFNAPPAVTVTNAGDELFDTGEAVTVTGTNFGATQGGGSVVISPTDDVDDPGAVTQGVNSWSDTSINIDATLGSLTHGVTVYLFVVNSAAMSNVTGYPVTFNEPPPTPIPAEGEFGFVEGIEFIEVVV